MKCMPCFGDGEEARSLSGEVGYRGRKKLREVWESWGDRYLYNMVAVRAEARATSHDPAVALHSCVGFGCAVLPTATGSMPIVGGACLSLRSHGAALFHL